MLLEGLPQLKGQRSDALPWFLKAAQAGAPLAQYQVGYSILKGWGCQCEEPKGMMWLRKAAAADQPDAQVTLAQATLRESQSVESVARAKVWLERAVAHDNRDAKFYLAALLAAAPLAEARDATRSAALLAQIFKAVDDDPTTFEIRAAAQAASGDFAKATKNQQKAVAMAKRLKWDLTSHNERLARYEAHEAWYGNLLPF
jgi:TPR repeat protein